MRERGPTAIIRVAVYPSRIPGQVDLSVEVSGSAGLNSAETALVLSKASQMVADKPEPDLDMTFDQA